MNDNHYHIENKNDNKNKNKNKNDYDSKNVSENHFGFCGVCGHWLRRCIGKCVR